jgi:2'-5' RNA ligase
MLIADLAARPRATDAVYLMVRPDPPAARQFSNLGRRLRRRSQSIARLIEEDRLHTTLFGVCPFGRLTANTLATIDAALSGIRMPPFLCGLDLVTHFGSEHNPAVVMCGDEGTPGVLMLQDELMVTMREIGLRLKRYTPHVTLGYGRAETPEQPVDQICWMVRGFALICSLHGRHQHVPLGIWSLNG